VHGARVANPVLGVLTAEVTALKPQSEDPSVGPTYQQLLNKPIGEEVPWPSDVPIVGDIDYGRSSFSLDVPEERCSCERVCMKGCQNMEGGYLCTPETCGAPSATCGRRFRNARGLKLKRTSTGIGVFLWRMLRQVEGKSGASSRGNSSSNSVY
jgi:hypothetical protein